MVLGPVEENAWPVSMFAIGTETVVAADPEMLRLYGQIERLARTQLPILIGGESGAGKEHAALAVHAWSTRAAGPFVALHCAALQDALLEGELFGYERGAFLGAVTGKPGLLERADGGTLFLDEVSALSPTAQIRLLRVLEEQRVTRLGGMQERALDVRIVASTSADLAAEVEAGRFRSDLFFRLNGAPVTLPPLRTRRGEIAVLAHHFLAASCGQVGRPAATLSPAAQLKLEAHAWPGNVRELRHAMAYAAALIDGDRVEPWHLPEGLGEPVKPRVAAVTDRQAPAATFRSADSFRPVAEEIRALEKRRMIEALQATGGVQRRAARLIGMPVRTFTCKLTQYNLRDRDQLDDDQDSDSSLISPVASVTGGEHVGPLHTNARAASSNGVLPSKIDGAAHGPAMHKVGT
jgi:DNA-binding NtrC family response regulator